MIRKWFLELRRRNKLLADFGLVYLFLFLVLVILPLFDLRELFGVSIWNKPAKFFLSTTILIWTIGWIMEDLPQRQAIKFISYGVLSMLSLELILITIQAIRGTGSHFNISTPFNGIVFSLMGIFIFINSLFFIYLLILFTRIKTLPKGYKIGIQIGLVIFIIAGYEGYLMAANLSHTVGAMDGQEGIYFLGWAKTYGDLRIFHFLGLHALQVLTLVGWLFFRNQPEKMLLFGLFYFFLASATLWLALQGNSIFFN
jgi:hypothetical protein